MFLISYPRRPPFLFFKKKFLSQFCGVFIILRLGLSYSGLSTWSNVVNANPEKDPEEWTTGEEPMTGPQRSYLQTLCREAGEDFNDQLTKAEASKKIEELQEKTGRGKK